MAQMVKNLLAMQETWVRSLGQEDPMEKGMTTHSSILAWRIQWAKELGRLRTVHGVAESDTTQRLSLPFFLITKSESIAQSCLTL